MRPLFELLSRPLLKVGLGPLARYGTHQEYLPSNPRTEWPAEGHYSSLHAFGSFKLPVPTDKNLNITTFLPRKSEKRCKRETS